MKKPEKRNYRLECLKKAIERPNSYEAQKIKEKDEKIPDCKRI